MKKLFFVIISLAALAGNGFAQTKSDDIRRLLELSGAKKQAAQMFNLMLPDLIKIAPDAPMSFWAAFENKLDLDEFTELFVPVYDTYFTHDEIRDIIIFYESPSGKKMTEMAPILPRIRTRSDRSGEKNLPSRF
ncbi:DUF2059 domain-containing protein [Brucepastera parasyntrophica]|uniref:DUF2059 domain-containing protein n=1 Tax=Brucepastera parasyntrophica TaxID=2880008 RepID=UPI00210B8723|nr:DUF2059 domain-containing protein [Brucepastera parasyntrophica]ULQ59485.1 DUF2059 domain-containing protein [Brucepastera parasyntrophica]